MGMFDQIIDKLFCPFCGEKNDCFQTKDMANAMDSWTIKDIVKFYEKGDVIKIYDECKKCKNWISINLDIRRLKLSQNISRTKEEKK